MRPVRANLFEGLALDRSADFRQRPQWLAEAWSRARLIRVDFEGRMALSAERQLLLEHACEVADALPEEAVFLGAAEDIPWFALPLPATEPGAARIGLREAAMQCPPFLAGLFAYAKALLLWHTRARFCGACGAETQIKRAGHTRLCSNPDCQLEHFPRTDAAIITLVCDGERALLGRGATWPEKRFSTLAGFVEPGESLEDALRREVFEEAGIRVGRCRYRSSQPWPFPASLMLGFYAEAESTELRLGDELVEARWFSATQIVEEAAAKRLLLPFPVSVSYRLIEDWLIDQLGETAVFEALGSH
ncbi:NAD(+) diphosphatase [Pseudomarimonas arenosa]|uniref:NAD(+) diphosphatase n=1 Tax=Pseudomarimonas arenosa TaxID=2774145 RepID=A0AAW3ZFR3_9GAMM|nr:NAD(+) diphosphatase [Pseudomarimonas arenosa]MBD8524938.1 NAD(+) diphosphatase [Pseudomarimonas arenosa]